MISFSLQAGLFSAVLTAFVVPKIQDLGLNPALESVYYQNQSLQILAQISQQIASIGTQIPLNITQSLPYPIFHPSASDRRVNVFWLMSLVCSLSASLLATVVQQWTRSYLRVYQRSKNPLRTARIQTFLSEGLELMPMMAEAAPGLIHISVFLFFAGLADAILKINTIVGVTIVVPIIICGFAYLYSVVAPLKDPQSSYRSPFFRLISYILRNRFRRTFEKMEARQEQHAMEQTKEREDRDVRAVQWLINNIDGSNEMDTFVLAIPGSFNEEYGQQVWKEVTFQGEFQPNVRDAQLTVMSMLLPVLVPRPHQEEPPLIISADACGTSSRATIPRETPRIGRHDVGVCKDASKLQRPLYSAPVSDRTGSERSEKCLANWAAPKGSTMCQQSKPTHLLPYVGHASRS